MPAWPPALRAGSFDAMLNFEIGDHPIYDSLELQWFDDVAHGDGHARVAQPTPQSRGRLLHAKRGLLLDPAGYHIGGGTGVWVEADFADARLEIGDDGIHASALFTDFDGRRKPEPTSLTMESRDLAVASGPSASARAKPRRSYRDRARYGA